MRRLLRALLVVVLLATAAPQALAQGLPDLGASMLVKEDLPDGFFRHLEFDADVPPIAPDAFAAHGGIARRLQVWTTTRDGGPRSVFDDRHLFPTSEAARAYLLDAEGALSEQESEGFELDPDAEPIGDLHRRYTLDTADVGEPLRYAIHLFAVGPLVAKVFVAGPPDVDQAAHTIAQAAAARMVAAVAAVAPPTPIPGPIASGGPDLSSVFHLRLLTLVSPDLETCHPVTERAVLGELAAIQCPIGEGGEVVVLRQLDTSAHLEEAFAPFRLADAGPPGTCRAAPAVEPHLVVGVAVGELSCFDAPDGTRVFIWTDARHDTLSWIIGTQERPFAALHDLYRSSYRDR